MTEPALKPVRVFSLLIGLMVTGCDVCVNLLNRLVR